MARNDDSNLLARITTALARIDDREAPKLPAAFVPDVKEFRSAVGPLVTAAEKAAQALVARDEALEKVGDADATLDVSLDDLADGVVGAKLGKRTSPFSGLSKHSPSALKNLAYKTEVDAVGILLEALAKKNPPAAVKAIHQGPEERGGRAEAARRRDRSGSAVRQGAHGTRRARPRGVEGVRPFQAARLCSTSPGPTRLSSPAAVLCRRP
jgi:hypothetical protein